MHRQFLPFPTLATGRLALRALTMTDAPEIFIQRSDPRMLQFVPIIPATTLGDAEQFIQRINAAIAADSSIFWAIALKNTPALIGTICLWNLSLESSTAEVGYMLHPDYQGQGYMQEALRAVLDYGFSSMQAENIVALPQTGNAPSIRLLERNHFIRSGEEGDYLVYTLGLPDYRRKFQILRIDD